MFFHNTRSFAFGAIGILLWGCTGSLQGGSIVGVFSGISSAVVLSPETVEINWVTNPTCNSYNIYSVDSSTSVPISTATVPPVKIPAQSDHSYTYAVGCVAADGTISGQNVNITQTTYSDFSGTVTSSVDTSTSVPTVDLAWSYPTGTGATFQVYAEESQVPGDLQDWSLVALPGGATAGYQSTYLLCSTTLNNVTLGPTGTCNTSSLNSGTTYNFKVVAKYLDETYSVDLEGNGTTIGIPAAFTAPVCQLTSTGIGADATSSYLFLQCGANASNGSSCNIANVQTTAYQAINGVRTAVSDTLNGIGTLRISPVVSTTSANTRTVSNLEIQYTCTTQSNAIAIVRYDGTNGNLQPALKYGTANYEEAPPPSYASHPSYLGGAFAIGDFNCDGQPDIAIGLPMMSYNYEPYLNQSPESGAVAIYYDYGLSPTGAVTSQTAPQYITFRDLPAYAHFGASLSAGNINKDVHQIVDSNGNAHVYGCDDLIIGAPGNSNAEGQDNGNGFNGEAFIFYGQPTGFPQPLDSAAIATNAATCSGDLASEVCAPVKLLPNAAAMNQYFHLDPAYTSLNGNGSENGAGTYDQVGFSVAYIRDFNADGYGDIAIGNPFCRWDGEGVNGGATLNPPQPAPNDVGCVYVFWGGPQGLNPNTYVGKTPYGTSLIAPFVKIYPPLVESGMHFGWSISGGGDVDGRLPVPVPQAGANIILANGNDFVVGAPDFKYNETNTEGGAVNTASWGLTTTDIPDPVPTTGISTAYNGQDTHPGPKTTMPWNGAWAPLTAWQANAGGGGFPIPTDSRLQNSTGIAFVYLGRSSYQDYDLKLTSLNNSSLLPSNIASGIASSVDPDTLTTYFAKNLHNRQNGSQYLTTDNAISWQNSPQDSFYNCGVRGGPTVSSNGSASGNFKHMSCLAGRNNFSVIYPTFPSGSNTPSVRFGSNVAIAGTAEQNLVALYAYGSQNSNYVNDYQFVGAVSGVTSLDSMVPFDQGVTHANINGTSLWEMGVRGLTTVGTPDQCELTSNYAADAAAAGSCPLATKTYRLGRSILDESYSFPSQVWSSVPTALPIADINRDGYADVIITANDNAGTPNGQVFTYFGNYAADFSYGGTTASNHANCAVSRAPASTVSNGTPIGFSSTIPTASPSPFSTFGTYNAGLNASYDGTTTGGNNYNYQFFGEYPQYLLPASGYYIRAAYLDDNNELPGTSIAFDYPSISFTGSGNSYVRQNTPISSAAANACLPQVATYTGSNVPSALKIADVNADGLNDVIIGFNAGNTGNGYTSLTYSAPSGVGLVNSGSALLPATTNEKHGTSLDATNWKFINGNTRRDIFSGAIGYNSGAGAGYYYSAQSNANLSSVPLNVYKDSSNSPNLLTFERSKIIGDVNGDGFDDIWAPIKQVDTGGNVYYDAMIFYGSTFGPITYTICLDYVNAGTLTYVGGGSVQASDCLGSTSPQVALIQNTQVFLPQYLHRPTGVGPTWALFPFGAGDVNKDGYQDVVIMDAVFDYSSTGMYLFFGSSSGLINNQPILGPSLNLTPQLVTANAEYVGTLNVGGINQSVAAASWFQDTNHIYPNTNLPQTQRPIVHGDFNGDGYEDIAFTMPYGNSPIYGNGAGAVIDWTCNYDSGSGQAPICVNSAYPPGSGSHPAPTPASGYNGSAIAGAGYVIILYGSATGYQTPVTAGQASDFPTLSENCSDFYTNCTSDTNGRTSSIRSVYHTLTYTTPNWSLDTTKTACDPSTGSAGTTAYSCTAGLIRNPLFFNGNVGGEIVDLQGMAFGSTLTVADTNHDGIDDLIVGVPAGSHVDWTDALNSHGSLTPAIPPLTTNSVSDVDPGGKGLVFIFYGAKGAGIVAPAPQMMLGDAGTGVTSTAGTTQSNSPIFQLYPKLSTGYPALDTNPQTGQVISGTTIAADANRNFGMGMTSGDFNGDGIDDVAIVSGNGQVYVYYGPFCQIDNSQDAVTVMYSNPGWACQTGSDPRCTNNMPASFAASASGTNCSLFNFNQQYQSSTTSNTVLIGQPTNQKPLYPQMIYINGVASNMQMGSTLLSKRPIRTLASIASPPNVPSSYPGNIDGDPDHTSDLVVGTNLMTDPNISGGMTTGLGYVFFGHSVNGNFPSLPGLYTNGSASYNAGITSTTIGSESYSYHSSVLLRPHTPDGVTGGFFLYETSMGDVNHDGTADLLMPTQNINMGAPPVPGQTPTAADQAAVISGGGFKLLY